MDTPGSGGSVEGSATEEQLAVPSVLVMSLMRLELRSSLFLVHQGGLEEASL